MKRNIIILTVLIALLGAIISVKAFSQSTEEIVAKENKSINGEISAIDASNSLLTLKYLEDEINQVYSEISFKVDEGTLVEKGHETAKIGDLSLGDVVEVEYSILDLGDNIAISIVVK